MSSPIIESPFCRITYASHIASFCAGSLHEAVLLSHVNSTFRSAIVSYGIPLWEYLAHELGAEIQLGLDNQGMRFHPPVSYAKQMEAAASAPSETQKFFWFHVLRASRFLWIIEALVRQGGIRSFAPTLPPRDRWRPESLVLVSSGADSAQRKQTFTLRPPLQAAVAAGNIALVKFLLRHTERDLELEGHISPLSIAAQYGRTALIEPLIVALLAAGESSSLEEEQERLRSKSGVQTTTSSRWCVSSRADEKSHKALKNVILQPEVIVFDALIVLIRSTKKDAVVFCGELLKVTAAHLPDFFGPTLRSRPDWSCHTLVHECVKCSAPEILRLILDAAPPPEKNVLLSEPCFVPGSATAVDTALELAVAKREKRCVKVLLAAGADPNRRNQNGEFPLLTAIKHNLHDMVELLLAESKTLNINQKVEVPPVWKSVWKPLGVVESHIEKEKQEMSALEFAALKGHRLIVKHLLGVPSLDHSDIPKIISMMEGDDKLKEKHAEVLSLLRDSVGAAPAAAAAASN